MCQLHGIIISVQAASKESSKKKERHVREADELELMGYTVERGKHHNGAYFAVIGDHQEHEKEVGRIFAENGFAFTLEREGNVRVRIKGRIYTLPSFDGRVEGFTHEIAALRGEPNERTVARAINHSHKSFMPDHSKSIQADLAITIAPKGSRYNKEHVVAGVKEFLRQVANGETKASPLAYLHVNETTRTIEGWRLK